MIGSRMRRTLTGVSAAFLVLGLAACGTSGSSAGGNAGALDPAGPSSSASAAGSVASPGATASAAVSGLRSFTFPAGVQVQFQTALPASGTQRSAVIGYENYVNSLWAAVATDGGDTTYKEYMGGNALTFADNLISEFRNGGDKLSGTVVYFDISVPQTYYGAGAVVQACVDASGLDMVSAATGKTTGTVFDSKYQHYEEQAATGKSSGGSWTVSHTQNLPASGGGSAGVCV